MGAATLSQGPGGLERRLQDALDRRGIEARADAISFALDLARLLVRSSGAQLQDVEQRALDRALASRTELEPDARAVLIELVLDPRFRSSLSDGELEAFRWRFGQEAAEALAAERADEVDLAGFASRYGPEEALLLLDGLFQIAGADGRVDSRESRALEQAADDLGIDGVVYACLLQRYDPRHAAGDLTWRLSSDRVTVGRSAANDVVIPDPQVAPHHCTFLRSGDGWRVVDAGSGRPVLLDGVPVSSAPLAMGSQVRIGPWRLQLIDTVLKAYGSRSFSALTARGLTRHIGEITLLEDVDFTIFEGEVVALVGPSGAGKTTLINAITGIAAADSGEVALDGDDFHAILAEDKSAVGLVPQDDLVHPELRVEESLFYSGRLRHEHRFPDGEVKQEVDRVLGELGIEHIRSSRIGDALKRGISGGQRKRVNLGQELLTRSTRLLFLDEPTSGLDPRSAHDIVSQVRQLADEHGRIVFLVTHDLAPGILAQVDHLMVLVAGGRIAYFGPPAEASGYFGVPSPDLLFDRLGERTPEEWAALWKESRHHRTYVATRAVLLERLGRPEEHEAQQARKKPLEEPVKGAGFFTQLRALTMRYALTKVRDRIGLGVLALQPLVLAIVIWAVFPVPTARLVFMLSLSCLWFGMSMAVRELISDRTIWRRERKVGVGVTPYLASKVGVLGVLCALQCGLFTSIVWAMMELGDYGYTLPGLGAVGALTGFAGVALGMLVSALYTSSEAAVGTLPLLLIPNICFCSVMVSLKDMAPAAKALTWITPERYAYDLMLKAGTHLEDVSRVPGKWDRKPISGPLYDLGLKGAGVEDVGLTQPMLVGALLAFAAVFLIGTWITTWARDRD